MIVKEQLSEKSERARRFYVQYMHEHIDGYREHSPFDLGTNYQSEGTMALIYRELGQVFKGVHEYNQFLKRIKYALYMKIIPEKEFDWITDFDTGYFAWNVLATMGPYEKNELEVDFNSKLPPLIKNGGIASIPTNKEEVLSALYVGFDNWDESLFFKTRALSSLRTHWINLSREIPAPFKWIDSKNYKQSEWAYQYVMKHINPAYMPFFTTEVKQKQLITYLTAVLYSWGAHADTKRLMIQRMKKTYSQNVFRESIVDKKVINTYVQKDVKKKLDMMAKKNKRKINEELEDIIMKAWRESHSSAD
ncbi:hypothetical protein [Yersinia intermedia]|uniref:hypothetical protein n=1 Tax=Yersinia intermedia TaxID=631 RepID=UPI0005E36B78|nr:hypothetical protein [Yersinia intermedia]CND45176.1 Uncharacterised protein [Yersinia intermedia]